MKSVPIIFLIFMFIILTIPAYAADTKKITSVNIQRIYKAKEGEINPDQVSFKPGRSEYIRECMMPAIYQSVLIWTIRLPLMLKKGMISNG